MTDQTSSEVNGETEPKGQDAKRSRSKLACSHCRTIKVRCIRVPEPGEACTRCRRYRLACTDPPPVNKAKGRPSNSERSSSPMSSRHPSMSGPSSYPMPPPLPASHPFELPFFLQPAPQYPAPPPPGHVPPANPVLLPLPAEPNLPALTHVSPTTFHSTSTPDAANNTLNMAEYLDPGDRDLGGVTPKAPFFSNAPDTRGSRPEREHAQPGERDDPVSLLVLSELEANSLVNLFHARLNPMVAVLDPKLHTFLYLRSSPILLSTVLACASRFFRRDLYPLLSSHASTILDRALIFGTADIGIVQSLMLSTYWKAPEDMSAWRRIGMAIRLGYSFFWHIPRTSELPLDELAARKVLNAERTWFCLFSFDRGLSYVYGLPPAIRVKDHGDPEQWARSHLHLGPSVDMHIAASIQLCKLKDYWGAVCELNAPDASYVDLAIDTLTSQCDALVSKWFSRDAPPPCFDQEAEHVLRWSILDFIFIMRRYRVERSGHDALRLDACLAVATQIAEEIRVLAGNGELEIMQDTASCMTSSLAVFLRKIFRHSSRSQKSNILSLLHRILLSHTAVCNEETNTATAYVTRFLRRILSALGVESRASTPRPMVEGEDVAPPQEQYDFFAELGLEEFMQVPEYVAQSEGDDGQYWASLFSA